MKTTDWYGLYSSGWGSDLVLEAYSHPAKVRPDLARKIYEHAIEEGWLEAGSVVLDPFGGIAGFALSAMKYGMHFIGVELEARFVELGQQNIELWNKKYSVLPGWGSAVLLQGDSRNLARVVAEAGAVVSSPPYAAIATAKSSTGVDLKKQYKTYRAQGGGASLEAFCETQRKHSGDYGNSKGQLAALPEGDLAAAIGSEATAIVPSPPYAGGCQHTGGNDPHPEHVEGGKYHGIGIAGAIASPPYSTQTVHGRAGPFDVSLFDRAPGPHGQIFTCDDYGSHPAQLGQMRDGGFAEACVSSPPFGGSELSTDEKFRASMDNPGRNFSSGAYSEKSLAVSSGDTFWSASRTIIEQVYSVLRPGGHAIFVTKSFIRKGKRVDFPGQWRELCEACGFVTLHQHRAWLVEDRGAQYDLMGELHERKVERKSFFRRLAERKARAAKLWPSLGRDERARYLMQAHADLWEQYHQMERDADPLHPPVWPTKTRMLGTAQRRAYGDAGQPDVDIDTAIDYEIVICLQKPPSAGA